MILTLFSFGFTWAIIAFSFYGLTHLLPGFFSDYTQSIFRVGFLLGLFDAAILKGARSMGFKPMNPITYLLVVAVDLAFIKGTNNYQAGYLVKGWVGPVGVAVGLGIVSLVIEIAKEQFRPTLT